MNSPECRLTVSLHEVEPLSAADMKALEMGWTEVHVQVSDPQEPRPLFLLDGKTAGLVTCARTGEDGFLVRIEFYSDGYAFGTLDDVDPRHITGHRLEVYHGHVRAFTKKGAE